MIKALKGHTKTPTQKQYFPSQSESAIMLRSNLIVTGNNNRCVTTWSKHPGKWLIHFRVIRFFVREGQNEPSPTAQSRSVDRESTMLNVQKLPYTFTLPSLYFPLLLRRRTETTLYSGHIASESCTSEVRLLTMISGK